MKKTGPDETTRRLVLRRDGYKCVICGLGLEKCISGYSIHHRRMRSHPWPDLNLPSNLICLCGSGTTGCHGKVHADPDTAYKNGWLVHAWEDYPATVPIQTSHGTMYLTQDGMKWDIFHSLLNNKGEDGMEKESNSLIGINLDGYRPISVKDCQPGDKVIISLKTYTVDDVQNGAVQLHESDSLAPVPFEYIGACYTKRQDLPKVPGWYVSHNDEMLYLSASGEWYFIAFDGGHAEFSKVPDKLLYKYAPLTSIELPE